MSESINPSPHQPAQANPDLADVAERVVEDDAEAVSRTANLPEFSTYNVVAAFEGLDEGRDALVALERAGIDGSKLAFLALDAPPIRRRRGADPGGGPDPRRRGARRRGRGRSARRAVGRLLEAVGVERVGK